MPTDNVRIAMGHDALGPRIDLFLTGVGFGFNPGRIRRARLPQIIALEASSDEELAHLGIDREGILPHVFRDLMG
ncbi:hypothetical protein [Thetidibacter halocola]|uniref:DUF1127 domain-containing protein n=1 Tax=Thetidibacter halocola TaxID=2827239 RepID=A0A8J7WJP3_9RHOB|nr:hypothetical protein [Thetidibacter halocola]MBS0126563.1 hypothetical protein [Thetidibacter halocola]